MLLIELGNLSCVLYKNILLTKRPMHQFFCINSVKKVALTKLVFNFFLYTYNYQTVFKIIFRTLFSRAPFIVHVVRYKIKLSNGKAVLGM